MSTLRELLATVKGVVQLINPYSVRAMKSGTASLMFEVHLRMVACGWEHHANCDHEDNLQAVVVKGVL